MAIRTDLFDANRSVYLRLVRCTRASKARVAFRCYPRKFHGSVVCRAAAHYH